MTRSPLQSPNLQGALWLAKPQVQRLFEVLSPEGEEPRCVGGCVRDTLAGAVDPNVEVDMATTLMPEAVLERLQAAGIRAIAPGLPQGVPEALRGAILGIFLKMQRELVVVSTNATIPNENLDFRSSWKQFRCDFEAIE